MRVYRRAFLPVAALKLYPVACFNPRSALRSRASALQSQVSSVRAAAELEASLADFNTQLDGGAYSEAAWTLQQLRRTLQDAESGGQACNAFFRRLAPAVAG